jgi:hypothetical protein
MMPSFCGNGHQKVTPEELYPCGILSVPVAVSSLLAMGIAQGGCPFFVSSYIEDSIMADGLEKVSCLVVRKPVKMNCGYSFQLTGSQLKSQDHSYPDCWTPEIHLELQLKLHVISPCHCGLMRLWGF